MSRYLCLRVDMLCIFQVIVSSEKPFCERLNHRWFHELNSNDDRLVRVLNCDDFVLKGVYHNGCMTKYLLKSSPKNEQKQDSDLSSNKIAFQNLIHEINDDLVVHPLNGLVLGACYDTCLWHNWNLFSTCKNLSDLFWKHCNYGGKQL
jgi:hypothetical protein